MKYVLLASLWLGFSGCGFVDGSSDDDKKDNKDKADLGLEKNEKTEERSESYTYQYSYNGCDTGKQTFSSQEAMCDGLLNESLNKYCAKSIRHSAYEKSCADKYGKLEDRL